MFFTHTEFSVNAWWRVDFGRTRQTGQGILWGRCDCCQSRLDGFLLWIGDSPTYNGQGNTNCYTATTTEHDLAPYTHTFECIGQGRYFFVHLPKQDALSLIEVQVYARGMYVSFTAIESTIVSNRKSNSCVCVNTHLHQFSCVWHRLCHNSQLGLYPSFAI
jgi:hypothetical protein